MGDVHQRSEDPVFKACTRPSMFAGVPMVPFLVISGLFLLVGMWTLLFINFYVPLVLAMIYFPLIAVLRQITKKDDQRLKQLFMRSRMRLRHSAGKALWGAVSYSPISYKRRAK
jgi:type IV secretion system protein VirB3